MKLSKFPKFLFFYSILILNLAIYAFQIYFIIGNFSGKKLGLISFTIEFYKNINPLFHLGYINSEFIVILSSLLLLFFIQNINNTIINIIYSSDEELEAKFLKFLNLLKKCLELEKLEGILKKSFKEECKKVKKSMSELISDSLKSSVITSIIHASFLVFFKDGIFDNFFLFIILDTITLIHCISIVIDICGFIISDIKECSYGKSTNEPDEFAGPLSEFLNSEEVQNNINAYSAV